VNKRVEQETHQGQARDTRKTARPNAPSLPDLGHAEGDHLRAAGTWIWNDIHRGPYGRIVYRPYVDVPANH
jgi:hypothetical protein